MKPFLTIALVGSSGQLATALVKALNESHCKVIILNREKLDLSQPEKIPSVLNHFLGSEPLDALINTAAYTQVDKAEEEKELAHCVNTEAPRALALWCKGQGVPFIHYSTDYVFSGEGQAPWREEDPTSPLNTYGKTKRASEQGIIDVGGKYLIFRASWIYDAHGKNFFRTMLRLGSEREQLRIVMDQVGAPTYAPHLAEATIAALKTAQSNENFPSGIYHLCSQGETTWHAFALCIFRIAREKGLKLKVKDVLAIQSSEYPTPAKRPLNSRLNTEKAQKSLGVSLPDWKVGLEDCMSEYIGNNS